MKGSTKEANLFEQLVVGWRGYRNIGSLGTVQVIPSNHLRIIRALSMHKDIEDDAVRAYIKHVQSILDRRGQ